MTKFDIKLDSALLIYEGKARLYDVVRSYLSNLPKRVFDEVWDNQIWPKLLRPKLRGGSESEKPTPTTDWEPTGNKIESPVQSDRKILDALLANPIIKALKSIMWGRGGTTEKPGKIEIIKVGPLDFNKHARDSFEDRDFGSRETNIRADMERTLHQRVKVWSGDREAVKKPVVILDTEDGYEIIEGWHRIMAGLLVGWIKYLIDTYGVSRDDVMKAVNLTPQGAEILVSALASGKIVEITDELADKIIRFPPYDFEKWVKVPIAAYVGHRTDMPAENNMAQIGV